MAPSTDPYTILSASLKTPQRKGSLMGREKIFRKGKG